MKKSGLLKKIAIILFSLFFAEKSIFAEDWVLAAREFSYTQRGEKSGAEKTIASLIPNLILENLSLGSSHLSTVEEKKDRKIKELQSDRISLFLQLSNAVKTRDSLVLNQVDEKKLKKAIREEDEKIDELKEKIDQNLKDTQTVREWKKSEEAKGFGKLKNLMVKSDGTEFVPSFEDVVLYKGDSKELFIPSKESLALGQDSWNFSNDVNLAKINGLLSGSITVYGEYCCVSVSLDIFPGNKNAGYATEVGSVSDPISIASSIAQSILPSIINSSPIEIYFDILPQNLSSKISVDGYVLASDTKSYKVGAGIHSIEVSCEGYSNFSCSYNFKDAPSFLFQCTLPKEENISLTLLMENPLEGNVFANGFHAGLSGRDSVSSSVKVNGLPVIGQFVSSKKAQKKVLKEITKEDGSIDKVWETEDGENLSSFYYIPRNLQKEGAVLAVNLDPQDSALVIDKRRVWMYRGYSALICTMPLLFYSLGNYHTQVTKWNAGLSSSQAELNKWNGIRLGSIGVSALAGGFFVFELVRYLKAADSVIPKNVHSAKDGEEEELLILSRELNPEKNEIESSSVNAENNDAELEKEKEENGFLNQNTEENPEENLPLPPEATNTGIGKRKN